MKTREAHRFSIGLDVRGKLRRVAVHGPPCNERGCRRLGDPCWLPDDPIEKPSEFYCWEHIYENGYCRGCGQFNAGIESFDFSRSGLCDNCQSQIDYEDEDDWDDDLYEWDDLPEADPWEEAIQNCSSMDWGRTCGAAGSEDCEFECLIRQDYRRSARSN